MWRKILCLLILLTLLPALPTANSQGASAWEKIVPSASFGYGQVNSVYWSPRSRQLAVVSESGLQFYDENLTLQGERRFPQPTTGRLLFSPDMRYVASEEYGGLLIRHTDTWEPILALGAYRAPSWSPDSRYLAIWAGNSLRIWDVETAKITLEVNELISEGNAIQWSPDNKVIAVAGPGAIILVRADSGAIVRIHPFYAVENFDWSEDGKWFGVIGMKDAPPLDQDPEIPVPKALMKMDAVTGEIVMTYSIETNSQPDSVNTVGDFVAISPNGRYIAADLQYWLPYKEGVDDYGWYYMGLGVWDFENGDRLHDFTDTNRPLASVTYGVWSPDGAYLATAKDITLKVFEAQNGTLNKSLQAYIPVTNQTSWQGNGKTLAVAGGLWDVTTELPTYVGVAPYTAPPQRVNLDFLEPNPYVFDYNQPPYEWKILQIYEDRGLVITYEQDIEYPGTPEFDDEEPPDERYIIWNIATQERWEEYMNLGEQTGWIYDLENADERANGNTYANVLRTTRFVAIGDDEIIDLGTGEKTMLEVNRWEWREVWFSPKGERIYAYDTDGKFKAYDPISGKLIYETVPAGRNTFRYSDDESRFVVTDGQNILYIYDSATGELLLETYTGNSSSLLLWSADMRRLAIGGDNKAIDFIGNSQGL